MELDKWLLRGFNRASRWTRHSHGRLIMLQVDGQDIIGYGVCDGVMMSGHWLREASAG